MRMILAAAISLAGLFPVSAQSPVERKANQEAARAPSQDKPASTQFGEINVAPLKDVLTVFNVPYKTYGSDSSDLKFSVLTGFKVEADGSLSNIRIITSSNSKIIDLKALNILWNIGQSHVLGPISDLSSATFSLDAGDEIARLRFVSFAATPEIAKEKADLLNLLFWALRMKEQSPDISRLLSLIKVKSAGKRVDIDLIMPRTRLAEMMQVPVAEEPRHHLKFENKYVRVFDVVVPPGDTTLFHIHANDYAFVSIGDAKLKAEVLGSPAGDLIVKDGEARFTKSPITHRVTNVGNTPFRNITIEILGSPGRAAPSKPDTAPGLTTVLDNDRVHIERLILEPGESTSLHTHGLSALSVFVTSAKVRVDSPGQKPQTFDYKPGDFRWRDAPTTHTLKNIGSTRFEAVGIDWK